MSGIDAVARIRELQPQMPVFVITAYADHRQAVAAVKDGALDYLAKPIDLDELESAIADAMGRFENRSGRLGQVRVPDWFVCQSAPMRRVIETVAVIAPSDAPVLILGESGTGKEMVSQLIHQWSETEVLFPPRLNSFRGVTTGGSCASVLVGSLEITNLEEAHVG